MRSLVTLTASEPSHSLDLTVKTMFPAAIVLNAPVVSTV